MSTDIERINKLVWQLLYYKKTYYGGNAVVPDCVYDALEDELRSIDPTHPFLSFVGWDDEEGKAMEEEHT